MLLPDPDPRQVDAERIYRLGLHPSQMMGLLRATHINYDTFRITEATPREALARALAAAER